LLKLPEEQAYEEFSLFIKKCRKYNPRKTSANPKIKNPITTKACLDIFDDRDKVFLSKQILPVTGKYYARKNDKGKITEIVFFVRTI
jgi:hypothetical protein